MGGGPPVILWLGIGSAARWCAEAPDVDGRRGRAAVGGGRAVVPWLRGCAGGVGARPAVEALGGSIHVHSGAGAGTHITADLPLEYELVQRAG